jgi:hypothetical protein
LLTRIGTPLLRNGRGRLRPYLHLGGVREHRRDLGGRRPVGGVLAEAAVDQVDHRRRYAR